VTEAVPGDEENDGRHRCTSVYPAKGRSGRGHAFEAMRPGADN
jgi:hypothetical protein